MRIELNHLSVRQVVIGARRYPLRKYREDPVNCEGVSETTVQVDSCIIDVTIFSAMSAKNGKYDKVYYG